MKQTLRSLVGGVMLLGMTLAAEAAAASTAAGESAGPSATPRPPPPSSAKRSRSLPKERRAMRDSEFRSSSARTTGALIAFAEARRHDKRDSGDIDLVMRRSEDDGRTWGPITTVWDDGGNTCGNPAPAVLGGGRIVMLATWNRGCDRERQIENRTSVDTRRVFRAPLRRPRTDVEPSRRDHLRGQGPGVDLVRHRPVPRHRQTPRAPQREDRRSGQPQTAGKRPAGSNPIRSCSSPTTRAARGSWEPFRSAAGTKARSPNSRTARCC